MQNVMPVTNRKDMIYQQEIEIETGGSFALEPAFLDYISL